MAKVYQIMIPKEEWKLAYLAGLIDGEGSIGLTKIKGKPIPYMQIAMCDKQVFDWIKSEFGGGCFSETTLESGKQFYRWHCQSRGEIHKLLSNVLRYLIVKKHKAQTIIQTIEQLGIPSWFWSKEEETFIQQNYYAMSNRQLARTLNTKFGKKRTHISVKTKACRLGVTNHR